MVEENREGERKRRVAGEREEGRRGEARGAGASLMTGREGEKKGRVFLFNRFEREKKVESPS